ncbi:MAG: heme biosynthesis HemY N-terminal domain-containing protein [Pseudomonadales bacterium]|jgi:HemY protein|tara:strand:+ start:1253 stop:2356 length:1104 start_codon:yes stop_codon:yes gene_type:complete
MRRLLLFMTIILALVVGTTMSRSPGYVLIAYEDMLLQTSLWVAVLGLLALLLALRWLWIILSAVLGTKNKLAAWSEDRRAAQALRFLGKSIVLHELGELKRANRYLERVRTLPELKPVSLAVLATGDACEARTQALDELALGSQAQKELAALSRALIALDDGLIELAAEQISGLPDNPKTLTLKRKVWLANKDWQQLAAHKTAVAKFDETLTLAEHQQLVAARQTLASDAARQDWLNALPSISLQDDGLLAAVFDDFDQPKLAEQCCRSLLEQSPTLALFLVYAELDAETKVERARQIKRWYQQQASANVLAAMGGLAAASGEHAQAIAHFSESLALKSSALIRQRLARSFLALGEVNKALAQLQTL